MVDRWAEEIVISELAVAREAGARFTLVSEECGTLDFGGGTTVVVVDPIDGSLNARRGLPLFSTSIAVADGPSVADVRVALVRDYGTGEEHAALRGASSVGDRRPGPAPPGLELVALEMGDPTAVAWAAERLGDVRRLRIMGSVALALCAVAAGRVDGLLTLGGTRAVDVAAAQLIAREGGAVVGAPHADDLGRWPLDVATRRVVVAARDEDGARRLGAVAEGLAAQPARRGALAGGAGAARG
jgi:myo-inositol-1(or 4)-monophosphatase